MVRARVYVEGGNHGDQRARCRKAFQAFFQKAGLHGRLPRVLACGSREDTYDDFKTALGDEEVDFAVLLVDSETGASPDIRNWPHLKREDGWDRPADAGDDQANLMVQCIEAWFLTDAESLKGYFGRGFAANALPRGSEVENIPKKDLLDGIKSATRNTKKGAYDKGKHTFGILEKLNPEFVCRASPHARHLVDVLRQKL